MECKLCRNYYNDDGHTPRLLIFCGHSICESCQKAAIEKGEITCPECSKPNPFDKIEDMPKNLALLGPYLSQRSNVASSKNIVASPQKKLRNGSVDSQLLDICPKHGAKYQAYCLKDKIPICLQCILGDEHKQHEFIAINEASEKEKSQLKNRIGELDKQVKSIEGKLSDIQMYEKKICTKAEHRLKEIQKLFLIFENLIKNKCEELCKGVTEILSKEMEKFCQSKNSLDQQLNEARSLKDSYEMAGHESNIEIQLSVYEREKEIKNVFRLPPDVKLSNGIKEFRADVEVKAQCHSMTQSTYNHIKTNGNDGKSGGAANKENVIGGGSDSVLHEKKDSGNLGWNHIEKKQGFNGEISKIKKEISGQPHGVVLTKSGLNNANFNQNLDKNNNKAHHNHHHINKSEIYEDSNNNTSVITQDNCPSIQTKNIDRNLNNNNQDKNKKGGNSYGNIRNPKECQGSSTNNNKDNKEKHKDIRKSRIRKNTTRDASPAYGFNVVSDNMKKKNIPNKDALNNNPQENNKVSQLERRAERKQLNKPPSGNNNGLCSNVTPRKINNGNNNNGIVFEKFNVNNKNDDKKFTPQRLDRKLFDGNRIERVDSETSDTGQVSVNTTQHTIKQCPTTPNNNNNNSTNIYAASRKISSKNMSNDLSKARAISKQKKTQFVDKRLANLPHKNKSQIVANTEVSTAIGEYQIPVNQNLQATAPNILGNISGSMQNTINGSKSDKILKENITFGALKSIDSNFNKNSTELISTGSQAQNQAEGRGRFFEALSQYNFDQLDYSNNNDIFNSELNLVEDFPNQQNNIEIDYESIKNYSNNNADILIDSADIMKSRNESLKKILKINSASKKHTDLMSNFDSDNECHLDEDQKNQTSYKLTSEILRDANTDKNVKLSTSEMKRKSAKDSLYSGSKKRSFSNEKNDKSNDNSELKTVYKEKFFCDTNDISMISISNNKKVLIDDKENEDDKSMILGNFNFSTIGNNLLSNQSVYIIGGYSIDPNCTIRITKYSPSTNAWVDQNSSSLRVKCSIVSSKDDYKCLLIGGKENGVRLSSIEEFDSKTDTMQEIPAKLPCPRSGCAAVKVDNKVYICGGNDGEQILDDCLCLDLITWEIKKLKPMRLPRDELSQTVGSDGRIYAIGGFGGNDHCCLKSVER